MCKFYILYNFLSYHDHQPEPDGVRPAQAAEVPEALLRPHLLLPLPDTEVFSIYKTLPKKITQN